jgi:DNA-binding LytR/AlgR family response regulator
MLRCRLKTVEESFQDSDLVRCHRKYIVNMQHVKVLTREKEGYVVDLDLEGSDPIPVTKTYEENVLRRFNSR